MGGGGLLRDDCEISRPHQKRCGERGKWSLARQPPPPSLPHLKETGRSMWGSPALTKWPRGKSGKLKLA